MAAPSHDLHETLPILAEKDLFSNQPLTLWIAEDDDDFREVLRTFLARDSLQIRLFSDGQEVVEALEKGERFDLLLADLKMPGVDGLGVLRHSKKKNPEGIVILMTGYAALDTAAQALQGGAYHYIRKPFKFAELEMILKHAGERLCLEWRYRVVAAELKARTEELQSLRASLARIRETIESSGKSLEQMSRLELLLRQTIPPDYGPKKEESQEKLRGLDKLVQLRKEGFLSEAELISFKRILLQI